VCDPSEFHQAIHAARVDAMSGSASWARCIAAMQRALGLAGRPSSAHGLSLVCVDVGEMLQVFNDTLIALLKLKAEGL
jgi:predicted protein tyrosine phosphatase